MSGTEVNFENPRSLMRTHKTGLMRVVR